LAATVGSTHPMSDAVRVGRCRVEERRGLHDVALELCSEVLGRLDGRPLNPVWMGRLDMNTSKALEGLGRRDEALALAQRALARIGKANPVMAAEAKARIEQLRWRPEVAAAPSSASASSPAHPEEPREGSSR
jgi:hypothetical protein